MRKLAIVSILFFSLALIAPPPASAATDAGVKPGSFFYFFDTASEKIDLFFTLNQEKKAGKALEYASERLAEAEESAGENDPQAVGEAMTDYEEKISLATKESKELKDEKRAEELLNVVSENTAKHQEVLSGVLEKVPDEVKEAIRKAIEVSRKGQEEAMKQVAELKSEVERLKKEIEELNKESNKQGTGEAEKLEEEVEAPQPVKTTRNLPEQKKAEEKSKTVTLPNGAVVETDANGNIIRTIKEAPQQTYTAPAPTTQIQTAASIQIFSINITPTITTAKIEWQTDKPTESKIFLSGGGFSSKVYNSETGLSTRHSVLVSSLKGATNYSYEIEAITDGNSYKQTGSFSTQSPSPPTFSISKEPVPGPIWPGWNYFKIHSGNGTFIFEVLTLEITDPDTSKEEYLRERLNYRRCEAINNAFVEWQKKKYPYPCPFLTNPVYLSMSNPNWKGETVSLTIYPDMIFPPGTEIYYYKVVEQNTGKVFEYQK